MKTKKNKPTIYTLSQKCQLWFAVTGECTERPLLYAQERLTEYSNWELAICI